MYDPLDPGPGLARLVMYQADVMEVKIINSGVEAILKLPRPLQQAILRKMETGHRAEVASCPVEAFAEGR